MSRPSLPLTGQQGKSNLPDKEFRYLRHSCYFSACAERPGRFGSAWLSASPRRSDHLIARKGVWRMASEDPGSWAGFLLIVRTGRIVTAAQGGE
jgi:hypothetical protein